MKCYMDLKQQQDVYFPYKVFPIEQQIIGTATRGKIKR